MKEIKEDQDKWRCLLLLIAVVPEPREAKVLQRWRQRGQRLSPKVKGRPLTRRAFRCQDDKPSQMLNSLLGK